MRIRRIGAAIAIGAVLIAGCSSESDDDSEGATEDPAATVEATTTTTAPEVTTTTASSDVVIAELVEGEIAVAFSGAGSAVATLPVDVGGGEVVMVDCELEGGALPGGGYAVGTEVEVRDTGSGWECLRIVE